jgi:hypothetical protein
MKKIEIKMISKLLLDISGQDIMYVKINKGKST